MTALWHGGPQQAFACSCFGLSGDPARAQSLLDESEAVIIGEVLNVNRELVAGDDPDAAAKDRHGRISTRIRVEQQFKGPGLPELEVRTAGDGAACGYDGFWQGGHHLLLLDERDGEYTAGLCGAFNMADIDRPDDYTVGVRAFIAELERMAPPISVPTEAPRQHGFGDDVAERGDNWPSWEWFVIGCGAVFAAGVALYMRRR